MGKKGRIWKKLMAAGILALLLTGVWSVTALASGFEEVESSNDLLGYLPQVENLKQTKATDNTITIQWQKPAGAEMYGINLRVKGTSSYERIAEFNSSKATVSYTIKNLKSNTFYEVQVFAGNSGDPSGMTKTIQCETTPGMVVGLKYSSNTPSKKMTFQWNRKQTADGYELYKYSLEGKMLSRYEVKQSNLSKISKTIGVGGNFYSYRIRAYTMINGEKCRGRLRYFYTSLQPEITKIYTVNSTSVKPVWSKINGASYQVYLSTSKNGTYKRVASTKSNQAVIKGLQKGRTYYIRVDATRKINGTTQRSPFTYYWRFTKN